MRVCMYISIGIYINININMNRNLIVYVHIYIYKYACKRHIFCRLAKSPVWVRGTLDMFFNGCCEMLQGVADGFGSGLQLVLWV